MPLDSLLFKKLIAPTPAPIVASTPRIAESDHIEAKANIIVERILNQGQQLTENDIIADMTREAKAVQVEYEDGYDDYDGYDSRQQAVDVPLPDIEDSGLLPTFPLDESQVAAINMMIQEQYCCMIGAAGSGKTTCQRIFAGKILYGDPELGVEPMKLRRLEGKQGFNIAFVAFTGIATQVIKSNLPKWLHDGVKTIHSLLEYGPVSTTITTKEGVEKESMIFMPMRHAGNKLDVDVIIIDESSMVGLDLWHQILDACRPGTKIFMVGDLNQLPPVMSQSIFAYTLSAWPVAELTHIHRQKEEAANKIVDVAHAILQGNEFKFDDGTKNPNWRVLGLELDPKPQVAGMQIVQIANQLRTKKVNASVDPEESLVYDPYRDRIITAGNGYEESDPNSYIQQFMINQALSRLIEPPSDDHPVYIIDAGRVTKQFAVGHRVMATKNEPPDVKDRVTNGMVGRIIGITKNTAWSGNHAMVGPEQEVAKARKEQVEKFFNTANMTREERVAEATADLAEQFENFDVSNLQASGEKIKEGGGPASHNVLVQFANGAERTFANKAGVESLFLAYASTCHKTQGSQFDTAIIICHHAAKSQLCREWFYTAVTRAIKRVIILYTPFGIRSALAKQKIFGRSLAEKIKKYKELQEEGVGILKVKVRLYIERAQ